MQNWNFILPGCSILCGSGSHDTHLPDSPLPENKEKVFKKSLSFICILVLLKSITNKIFVCAIAPPESWQGLISTSKPFFFRPFCPFVKGWWSSDHSDASLSKTMTSQLIYFRDPWERRRLDWERHQGRLRQFSPDHHGSRGRWSTEQGGRGVEQGKRTGLEETEEIRNKSRGDDEVIITAPTHSRCCLSLFKVQN